MWHFSARGVLKGCEIKLRLTRLENDINQMILFDMYDLNEADRCMILWEFLYRKLTCEIQLNKKWKLGSRRCKW